VCRLALPNLTTWELGSLRFVDGFGPTLIVSLRILCQRYGVAVLCVRKKAFLLNLAGRLLSDTVVRLESKLQ